MSSLLERLNRHRSAIAGSGATAPRTDAAPGKRPISPDSPDTASRRRAEAASPQWLSGNGWDVIEAEQVEGVYGPFVRRQRRFPLQHRHGLYEFGELAPLVGALDAFHPQPEAGEDEEDGVSLERLLFFDSETTGLGVGAGNVPFMLGFGYYERDEFVVEQLMIRDPGEEAAMLAYLNERFARFRYLVTYNGRTFDWPILRGRFVLCRLEPERETWRHLDLLYASRSLWKGTMPSCRLATVEAERLGFAREDDVSGALAPTLYFRYLADGDAAVLHGVFVHNERDVMSLATLAIHIALALRGRLLLDELDAAQLLRLGMWLEKMGQSAQAELTLALLCGRPLAERGFAAAALAAYYKRKGNAVQAAALWREAAEQERAKPFAEPDACIELAVLYEHRLRDPRTALHYAEEALRLALKRESMQRRKPTGDSLSEQLRRRMERLRRKCEAAEADPSGAAPRKRSTRVASAPAAVQSFF
ncbi:ribonuclease H-like domain-containing protein [Paenibacillus cymbidii]|uniref:ribonuclease H-like domain-containing protein n=1 Tax=Paenibacillus cymbidii TaxID=1639034 RepID=UPI0010803B48|nr:ribonuclease H-like domain-containing protein [Paenibacillus cymbidii]